MTSGDLDRLHAQEAFEGLFQSLLSERSYAEVLRSARRILGADSFGLGVCYGLLSYPVQEIANLLELAKVFLLADLHDQVCRPFSVSSFLRPTAGSALFVRGLFAFGEGMWLQRRLVEAHRQRELLFRELSRIMENPAEFFVGLPARLQESYQAKWQRFLELHRATDVRSQFEAGKTFGELVMELLVTIASLAAMGGAVVRLASKAPQLVRAAQRLTATSRARGVATTAAESEPLTARAVSARPKPGQVASPSKAIDSPVEGRLPPKSSIPNDITEDPRGVHGYMPTEECSVKDMLDFSDPVQVASARESRMQYLNDLAVKRAETDQYIAVQRRKGYSDDEIARKLVDKRNADRMATYEGNPEGLAKLKLRNAKLYDRRENGPDYDYLIEKGKTREEILYGTTKSNRSMDILLGLEKPGG